MEVIGMRRIRVQVKPSRRKRTHRDVLPLDPRDPDVVRAKQLARLEGKHDRGSADATSRAA
jgi:hypothetical protein